MDEQDIPIDINTNKLLEWLVSRRHIGKDWQNAILPIREKINNAIQDMPAHDGIIKLLSGQHINYFHCVEITDILKETEKDTKNIFGRYGSQRMKDWQEILGAYLKDNVYLAEVAQILARNVIFEIPSLRKQIAKLTQMQIESEKKIKDYSKSEAVALKEYNNYCDQLGIKGENITLELLELLKQLPEIYEDTSDKIKTVKAAVDLYTEFIKYVSGQSNVEVLPSLCYLIKNGNTTTYEYIYSEKPIKIEEPVVDATITEKSDVTFGDNAIDFGDDQEIDFGEEDKGQSIDWGSSNEESFEIVSYDDVELNLEESGIVVEKSGIDGGIARGSEALTILDNPETRELITNGLKELEAFLKMRLYEMSNEGNVLSILQMQDVSSVLQMQSIESVTALHDCVSIALNHLTSKKLQHLHSLKHSPKYIDVLTANLKQKLVIVDRMKKNKAIMEAKIKEIANEIRSIEPVIKLLTEKTKELQKHIESDLSAKYKGRTVNIIGAVNML